MWQSTTQRYKKMAYVYKVFDWKNKDEGELQVLLDAEGINNWELVSFAKDSKDYTCIFKRRQG